MVMACGTARRCRCCWQLSATRGPVLASPRYARGTARRADRRGAAGRRVAGAPGWLRRANGDTRFPVIGIIGRRGHRSGMASPPTGAAASARPVTANLPVVSRPASIAVAPPAPPVSVPPCRLGGQSPSRRRWRLGGRCTPITRAGWSWLAEAAVTASLNPGPHSRAAVGPRGPGRAPAAQPSMQITPFYVPEPIITSAAAIADISRQVRSSAEYAT